MANKKFSQFDLKTNSADVQFVVGYNGTDNVRIAPNNLGGGATSLNGLSDCLVDTDSLYVGEVPAGLSGNPQGNTVLGIDAGNSMTDGNTNTIIGNDAAYSSTWANNNVIVGYQAAYSNTYRWGFVAIGYQAAKDNTNNQTYGTFIGYQAGKGSNNNTGAVCIGMQSGLISAGQYAVAIGQQSGRSNTATGTIAIGHQAGYSNTAGDRNIYIGYQAGYDITTGEQNTLIGYQAGENNTGSYNTSLGADAGRDHTGAKNVIIGAQAGLSMTTSDNNIVIGYDAEPSTATVDNEITLGDANITSLRIPGLQSGASNNDVLTYNSSTGNITLQAAGGGGASDLNGLSDCKVDGTSLYVGEVPSGLSGNPPEATILGIDSGAALTTGQKNTLLGHKTGNLLTTQWLNCYVGTQSGAGQIGQYNTGLGSFALQSTAVGNRDGDFNVAVGYSALSYGCIGDRNTCIGPYASSFSILSGNNNIIIGNQSGASSTSVSNEITLGNSSITALRCAVTSITSLSDERDKSEIKDLEYGLAFIDALQPREFVWDNRPETTIEVDEKGNETEVEFYSDNKGKKDFGFIAQEVRELDNDTLRLVYSENEDRLEMSYGKLVPILVKAIQELKEEVELLKS